MANVNNDTAWPVAPKEREHKIAAPDSWKRTKNHVYRRKVARQYLAKNPGDKELLRFVAGSPNR